MTIATAGLGPRITQALVDHSKKGACPCGVGSQDELATLVGCTQPAVSQWIAGTASPQGLYLRRLETVLDKLDKRLAKVKASPPPSCRAGVGD